MVDVSDQNVRLLMIYQQLIKGAALSKKDLATEFGVNEKTIQRYFGHIRSFLLDQHSKDELVYDRKLNKYILVQEKPQFLLAEEILAISKIILDARAFPKEETHQLLNKLVSLAKDENKTLIDSIIHNEKQLFVELQPKMSVLDSMWGIAQAIHERREIEIYYKKELAPIAKPVLLQPLGLIFSEYYFYLIAYDIDNHVSFPKVYRVDRITTFKVTNKRFKVQHVKKFEEGEFRKRVQFMYTGDLITIEFYFKGASPQAVLDRLPTATIKSRDPEKGIKFSAEVYGKGIQMWLLSQGPNIEVISPPSFRQTMKQLLKETYTQYLEE